MTSLLRLCYCLHASEPQIHFCSRDLSQNFLSAHLGVDWTVQIGLQTAVLSKTEPPVFQLPNLCLLKCSLSQGHHHPLSCLSQKPGVIDDLSSTYLFLTTCSVPSYFRNASQCICHPLLLLSPHQVQGTASSPVGSVTTPYSPTVAHLIVTHLSSHFQCSPFPLGYKPKSFRPTGSVGPSFCLAVEIHHVTFGSSPLPFQKPASQFFAVKTHVFLPWDFAWNRSVLLSLLGYPQFSTPPPPQL